MARIDATEAAFATALRPELANRTDPTPDELQAAEDQRVAQENSEAVATINPAVINEIGQGATNALLEQGQTAIGQEGVIAEQEQVADQQTVQQQQDQQQAAQNQGNEAAADAAQALAGADLASLSANQAAVAGDPTAASEDEALAAENLGIVAEDRALANAAQAVADDGGEEEDQRIGQSQRPDDSPPAQIQANDPAQNPFDDSQREEGTVLNLVV